MRIQAILAAVVLVGLCGCSEAPAGRSSATSGSGMDRSGVGDLATSPVADSELGGAGDRVLFDTDSAVIADRYQPTVEILAAWFRAHPSSRFAIEGHADERGTREYNLALGDRRAMALRNALVDRGLSATQVLRTISYGKERPEAAGSNENAWASNRRAVIVVEN